MSRRAWIGVDLDGTLAVHTEWSDDGGIGVPVPAMLARVRRWLADGLTVKIMTARVGPSDHPAPHDVDSQRAIIEAYCLEHLGRVLPVTATKDYEMVQLWDDRAVHVVPNTGRPGVPPDADGCYECGAGLTVLCTACNPLA